MRLGLEGSMRGLLGLSAESRLLSTSLTGAVAKRGRPFAQHSTLARRLGLRRPRAPLGVSGFRLMRFSSREYCVLASKTPDARCSARLANLSLRGLWGHTTPLAILWNPSAEVLWPR